MEIVLLILKIIGIILLSVIGIVFLLAALIMFYPVSYSLQAAYEDSLCAKVKVHWLFHLFSVTLDYKEAGKKCILRIFGIPIMDFLNPRPKKEKKKKTQKRKKKKSGREKNKKSRNQKKKESVSDISEESRPRSQALENENSSKKNINTEAYDSAKHKVGAENGNFPENEKEKSKSKRKAFWEKLTGFPKKLKMLIENMIQKVANLYHKGIDLKEKVEKWLEVLKRERTRQAIGKAKQKIMKLLRHVLPRKWNAYVEYGFEDPGTTGQMYGYYWMFLGIWNEHFICVPDFEHKIFKGSIKAKGRMQVIRFLYTAFQFMFDKDLDYLRKINTEVNS